MPETASLSVAKPRKAGRPEIIEAPHLEALREIVRERPSSSLEELVRALQLRCGLKISWPTLRKALKKAGIRRVHRSAAKRSGSAPVSGPSRPYGYTDAHRDEGDSERPYGSCLTDAEWKLVGDIFENEGGPGKPPLYSRRSIVDACCYVVRTGCSWRMLPKDFPPWMAVYKSFRRWTDDKKFEVMHDRLRAMWRERAEERRIEPTAAVLDSQSVKTSPQGGPKGFDAAKKVKGRKRHILVDTLGLILALLILPANIQDRDAAAPVVAKAMDKHPTIQKLYVDGAYGGQCAANLAATHKLDVDVVRHPANGSVGRWQIGQQRLFPVAKGFVVLPKRWVVERTHSWNDKSRRLVRDHDRRIDVAESWVWLTEARLLARRLTTSGLALA